MSLQRRLLIAPRAVADLDEIGSYIAQGSPARALSFLDEIEAKFGTIASAPASWPLRPDLLPGIRMATHGRYLIFYRDLVELGTLRVERVLHGARDLRRLF